MSDSNDPLRVLCFASAAVFACGAVAYWNVAGPNAPMFTICAVGFTFLAALLPHAGSRQPGVDNSSTKVTNNIYTAAPAPQPQYQPQPAAYYPPPQMQQPQIIMMPAAQPGMTPEMVAQIVRGMTQAQAQTPLLPPQPVAAESRYMGNVIDVTPERAPPMLLLPTDRRHLSAQPEPQSAPMRLLQRIRS
jgi:hypothetical protein